MSFLSSLSPLVEFLNEQKSSLLKLVEWGKHEFKLNLLALSQITMDASLTQSVNILDTFNRYQYRIFKLYFRFYSFHMFWLSWSSKEEVDVYRLCLNKVCITISWMITYWWWGVTRDFDKKAHGDLNYFKHYYKLCLSSLARFSITGGYPVFNQNQYPTPQFKNNFLILVNSLYWFLGLENEIYQKELQNIKFLSLWTVDWRLLTTDQMYNAD